MVYVVILSEFIQLISEYPLTDKIYSKERNFLMNYGKLFSKLRKDNHFTQKEVCQGIVAQAILSRFESKNGRIDFDILIKLLNRIHIHPIEFLSMCNQDFISDEYAFNQRLHAAYYNFSDNQILLNEERKKFEETHDIHHLINSVRVEATYCIKNGKPFSHLTSDINVIKNYLISLDSWFISEIILYLDIFFIFDDNFIKSQHARMIRSLSNLPFGIAHKDSLQASYGHNVTVLAFERGNFKDIPLYLSYFERTLTKDPRSLTNALYYSAYLKLWHLIHNYSEYEANKLFKDITIFKQYGYEDEYFELKKFISQILNTNLHGIN